MQTVKVSKLLVQPTSRSIALVHRVVRLCIHAVPNAAGAVEDIEMLFYHVETVDDVNFTQQWGPVVALKHSKPSVYH